MKSNIKTNKKQEYFPITSVCRADLDILAEDLNIKKRKK